MWGHIDATSWETSGFKAPLRTAEAEISTRTSPAITDRAPELFKPFKQAESFLGTIRKIWAFWDFFGDDVTSGWDQGIFG